jgi:DNA-binding MarR family transcriptional regulator
MARKKGKGTELSVFKGREAKLNRAIFKILIQQGPQTIYNVHKQIIKTRSLKHTRYANVNMRVRALEESGFVKKRGLKEQRRASRHSYMMQPRKRT